MVLFYFIAGVVVGVATSLIVVRMRHRARAPSVPRRWYLLAGAVAASFTVVAAIMYLAIELRHPPQRLPPGSGATGTAAMASAARNEGATSAPGTAPSGGTAAANSMQDAVAGLEARLAREGGSPAEWTLLAQAYEFLGRAEDARRARAHVANPGPVGPVSKMNAAALAAVGSATEGTSAPAAAPGARTPDATAAVLEQRVAANARDAQSWLALANLRRAQRDYAGARDAFARTAELNAMTAQSWADYADTLGTLAGGSLSGEAGRAIDRALALDAANPKALWLKASQAHEQHRFADALLWWQKLHAVLPADSPDAQVVAGNIAEDTALAGQAPAAASRGAGALAAGAAGVEVSGTVSLDARFASRVSRDSTLFIYAKAADSSGPPLAVLRTTASAWPVSFRLDDSMAMIPSRRLSQFDKVVVEARISRSGQAMPAAGDLYVTSPVLHPAAGKKLALVIDREIG
jgi:cytochrome c-type biogenesis protein CcmH